MHRAQWKAASFSERHRYFCLRTSDSSSTGQTWATSGPYIARPSAITFHAISFSLNSCHPSPAGVRSSVSVPPPISCHVLPMNRHCHACGVAWNSSVSPGRTETCQGCRAELRCCLNCISYDARAAEQCRDRRADPVLDKDRGNFCEFFQFATRSWSAPALATSREQAARDTLKSLFDD